MPFGFSTSRDVKRIRTDRQPRGMGFGTAQVTGQSPDTGSDPLDDYKVFCTGLVTDFSATPRYVRNRRPYNAAITITGM